MSFRKNKSQENQNPKGTNESQSERHREKKHKRKQIASLPSTYRAFDSAHFNPVQTGDIQSALQLHYEQCAQKINAEKCFYTPVCFRFHSLPFRLPIHCAPSQQDKIRFNLVAILTVFRRTICLYCS